MSRWILTWSLLFVGLLLAAGARPAEAALPKRAVELRDALAKTIPYAGLDDARATLWDVLEQMAKQIHTETGVRPIFDIDEKAFQTENYEDVGKTEVANPPLPPMHASAATVLKKILSRIPVESGATYVIRADKIEITTNAALQKRYYSPGVRKPFFPLVVAGFDNKPLDQALRELAEQTGDNVILDARADKEGKTPVSGDFLDVPLDDAVFLLADMASLVSVRITPTTLYVTTPRNAQAIEKRQQEQRAREEKPPARPADRETGGWPGVSAPVKQKKPAR